MILSTKKCVACAEDILQDAILCKHCKTMQDDEGFARVAAAHLEPELKTSKFAKIPKKVFALVLVALVIVAGAIGGATYFQNQENDRLARVAAEAQASAAAKAEADERARIAAEEAEKAAEIADRLSVVPDIEESIAEMARDHISKGLIRGKVIEVQCSPTSGYSLDNLEDSTTEFVCFAATKDNGDGTQSGYYYEALMDWGAGTYSYGLQR